MPHPIRKILNKAGFDLHRYHENPDHLAWLDKLTSSSRHNPKFKAFNFALGEKTEKISMNKNSYTPSSSLLAMTESHKELFPHTKDSSPSKIRALGWEPRMTLDRYLPICKMLNEERSRTLPPGKKERLARALGLGKILYGKTSARK